MCELVLTNVVNIKPLVLSEIFLPINRFVKTSFDDACILSEKYRVSNYGCFNKRRIYNIIDCCFCKLSLCGVPNYNYVTLTHKNARRTLRVHRLVAMSFVKNINSLSMVDHIDRNNLNNSVSNLRWVC